MSVFRILSVSGTVGDGNNIQSSSSALMLREAAYSIRFEVFVDEQGIPRELELDSIDTLPTTTHYVIQTSTETNNTHQHLVWENIGCCRTFPYKQVHTHQQDPQHVLKLGRLAVRKQYRKMGVGKRLMEHVMKEQQQVQPATTTTTTTIVLHAQTQASGFYSSLGFVQEGGEFDEDGVRHVKMVYKTF